MDTRKLTSRAIPADVTGNLPAKPESSQTAAGQSGSIGKSNQADKSTRVSGVSPDSRPVSGERGVGVSVSPRAREIAESHKKAFEIAKATPDIREDRVAELKRQIQAGTYKPDPARIADGIAREALFEYLASPEGKDRI